jgi:hypothetical protein
LAPAKSITQFVIEQLLKGLAVQVTIDGWTGTGYVHQLDFAPGEDFVFATVAIPDPANNEESLHVRVSIRTDGIVTAMPNQPED